jgi:hypothetical protein
MSNITSEFNFGCLQVLVKIYSLHDIYAKELQKVLTYMVNTDHNELRSAMLIVQQLKLQLLNAIIEGQNEITNCD